jgi:hypothetical protein
MLRYAFCQDETAYWDIVYDLGKDFLSVLSQIKNKKIVAITSQNLKEFEKQEIEKLGVKLIPAEIRFGYGCNERIVNILKIQ